MTHPPVDTEDDVIEAQYADPEDVFYLDWGRETYKASIPRLGDALQRVVTLATALLGGTMFFASADVVPAGFRVAAMVCFLASLTLAFYGAGPHKEGVGINDPNSIRAFKEKVLAERSRWLWNATAALWLGLFVATLGALLKVANLA